MVTAVVLIGSPGAGKSSVLEELASLHDVEDIPHGVIEAEQLSLGRPLLPASSWTPQLAAVLSLQRQAGRSRFLVSATVETAEDLAALRTSIAAELLLVVCLSASPETVATRIDARESDEWPGKAPLIERARSLASSTRRLAGIDLVVDTEGRVAKDLAGEILEAMRSRGMLAASPPAERSRSDAVALSSLAPMKSSPPYRVMALDGIETAPTPANIAWRAVRAALGIRAFGVGSYLAPEAGEDVIEAHTESTDGRGHEELYLVARGAATFSLDGERFDAPAGTCVFVGDPSVHRHAVASEPNTEVLAFGGEPVFEPAGDEWMWRVRPLLSNELDRAREVADAGLAEAPGNPGVLYAQALVAAAGGRPQDAREWLASAVELEPRLLEEARGEDLLGAVAGTLDDDGV